MEKNKAGAAKKCTSSPPLTTAIEYQLCFLEVMTMHKNSVQRFWILEEKSLPLSPNDVVEVNLFLDQLKSIQKYHYLLVNFKTRS